MRKIKHRAKMRRRMINHSTIYVSYWYESTSDLIYDRKPLLYVGKMKGKNLRIR